MIFFGLIRESLQFAYQALILNKLRTFLSLLGITIGIFSIISVLTAFDSLENSIRKSISSLGSNVIYVQKFPFGQVGENYPWWKYIQRPQPSAQELNQVLRASSTINYGAFTFDVNRTVEYKSNNLEQIDILSVSQDFNRLRNFNLQEGRFFTPIESNGGQAVAVLGSEIAENLFAQEEAIGKYIKIAGYRTLVIGVVEQRGDNTFGGPNDNQVMVPSSFAQKFARSRYISTSIMLEAKPGVSVDQMKDEVTGIMRSIRHLRPGEDNNFSLNQVDVLMQSINKVFGVISIVGWVVGGFSLLVGGFGIANIMFVSVKERTAQIGIQKSLGAKNSFILQQFLFESIFLSLLGGVLGLLIVFLLGLLVTYGFDFKVILNLKNVIVGLSVSGFIGIVAGYIPAYTASRLDPVEAMRSGG